MSANYQNEGFVTYGGGQCPRCEKQHEIRYQIKETAKARFVLMRIISELALVSLADRKIQAWNDPRKPKVDKLDALRSMKDGLVGDQQKVWNTVREINTRPIAAEVAEAANMHSKKNKMVESHLKTLTGAGRVSEVEGRYTADPRLPKFVGGMQPGMLGVLITPKMTYISASGKNPTRLTAIGANSFVKGPSTICAGRNGKPHKSIVKRSIENNDYASTAVDNPPGDCAAPRVIQAAIDDGLEPPIEDWAMSEIWYDPAYKHDDSYIHGLSAKHCSTCDKLVPLLLCPHLEDAEMGDAGQPGVAT